MADITRKRKIRRWRLVSWVKVLGKRWVSNPLWIRLYGLYFVLFFSDYHIFIWTEFWPTSMRKTPKDIKYVAKVSIYACFMCWNVTALNNKCNFVLIYMIVSHVQCQAHPYKNESSNFRIKRQWNTTAYLSHEGDGISPWMVVTSWGY